MKKPSAWDGVALLSIAASLVATWMVFDRLPEPLPVHFGLDGRPNGWMPRAYGAWLLPGLTLVVWLVTRLLAFVLPKSDKLRLTNGTVPLVAMMPAVFMAAVQVVVLYVALVPNIDVSRIIFALMALLFIALGLVMPRIRRNPIMGVRTAWTLTSDENWARTHRVAGYSMALGGLLGFLLALIGGAVGSIAAIACFLGSALVPAVWSFLYARRHDQRQ